MSASVLFIPLPCDLLVPTLQCGLRLTCTLAAAAPLADRHAAQLALLHVLPAHALAAAALRLMPWIRLAAVCHNPYLARTWVRVHGPPSPPELTAAVWLATGADDIQQLEWLMSLHPGRDVLTSALDAACALANPRVVAWATAKHPITTAALSHAIRAGHTHMLPWTHPHTWWLDAGALTRVALAHAAPPAVWTWMHAQDLVRFDKDALAAAATSGHATLVDLVVHHAAAPNASQVNAAYLAASRMGHVHVLTHLLQTCVLVHARTTHPMADYLAAGARGGHLAVLRWWRARGPAYVLRKDLTRAAVVASRHGHVCVLAWLRAERLLDLGAWAAVALASAATGGHVAVLRWWAALVEGGVRYLVGADKVQIVARRAFVAGHVPVLTWLVGEVGERQVWAAVRGEEVERASAGGHAPVLAWWWASPRRVRVVEIGVGQRAMEAAERRGDYEGYVVADWWRQQLLAEGVHWQGDCQQKQRQDEVGAGAAEENLKPWYRTE